MLSVSPTTKKRLALICAPLCTVEVLTQSWPSTLKPFYLNTDHCFYIVTQVCHSTQPCSATSWRNCPPWLTRVTFTFPSWPWPCWPLSQGSISPVWGQFTRACCHNCLYWSNHLYCKVTHFIFTVVTLVMAREHLTRNSWRNGFGL